MAAVELRPSVSFDAEAFADFLAAQGDLGTKWSPSYVRVVDSIPVTGTGKLDRKSLRAHRWQTTDPVWWKRGRTLEYLPMTDEDRKRIDQEFRAAGRGHLLG
jgi:fatty-acyl-CoA synthase